MKAQSSINSQKGFSTIEIMIAMMVLTLALTGALSANVAAQYWSITSGTSNEALYQAKTQLENTRGIARGNFYAATSTPYTKQMDTACSNGGLCYFVASDVTDISSCSKQVEASIEWRVPGYPTSTTSLFTHLTNADEAVSRGGDCLVESIPGDWTATPTTRSGDFSPGRYLTGIDALHGKIYLTASTSPQLAIFAEPAAANTAPMALGSVSASVRLNALDVIDDLGTGRTYAFVAQAATTSQLAVYDVTDSANPTLVITKRITGSAQPTGAYAEGWRLAAYGGRLYITTRPNPGNEFFIFDITTPTQPTQIGDGFALDGTVSDMVVRDEKVNGSVHRLVFLTSDSDSEEFRILDVTGDSISELSSRDLSGSNDALSLALLGNTLYVGRVSNGTGPELYAYDVTLPSNPIAIKQGEVGADVIALQASGKQIFLGTRKSTEEFQAWNADATTWNPSVLNTGRLSKKSIPHLASQGIELESYVYAISQFISGDSLFAFFPSL